MDACLGPDTDAAPDAELGARLQLLVRSAIKGLTIEDLPNRERDALSLLRALHQAYSNPAFQAEIRQLHDEANGDELRLISSLGPAAARVQAPVFTRFGLPLGQRGVMLMKMGVKAVSERSCTVRELAGDLRELLGLTREETTTSLVMKEADKHFKTLVAKIARVPVDLRGPLAEALRLPYKASPEDIAKEVPRIRQRAEELAEKTMARPRAQIVGDGQLLGPEMAGATDGEVRAKLVVSFEHYLNKMLARVITPVDSFTRPAAEFESRWAEGLVQEHHAMELWGPQSTLREDTAAGRDWLRLGIGVTVADGVVDEELLRRMRRELAALEVAGELQASKDPCNVGARSVWLHFETEEERSQVPPALLEVCLRLAGLPAALHARAAARGIAAAPSLCVHPHVMAATYKKGAEYHVHKDSYNGTDNQRMLSVLLYLNHEWQPGDGGELRVFATKGAPGVGPAEDNNFVDIAPLSGRLVMFRSREVWHAVREPREQRWALTLWVMAE